MVSKKHPLYRLEKKRSSFLAIGFLLSLFMVLTAMEWTTETSLLKNEIIFTDPPLPGPIPPPVPPTGPTEPPEPPDDPTGPPKVDGKGKPVDEGDRTWKVDTIKWEDEDEEWGYHPIPKPPVPWAPVMPVFRGGEKDRKAYLDKHIKYPQMAIDAQISGTVYVSFIVNTKGQVQQVKIKRGIGGGCDDEVIRVVESMKGWKPGRQGDTKVAVIQTMPIQFELQ